MKKQFRDMKNSEITWIGNIPENWTINRNKHFFKKSKTIVGENSKYYKVLSLTKQGVIEKDIETNAGKMPESFDIYQIINPDSLLLCLFDIDVTPRTIGYVEQTGIVSSAYTNIKIINNDIVPKYYYYWFLMLDMDKRLLHLTKNLRYSINIDEFMDLPVIKPSKKEQQAIVEFLDKKIKQLDEAIRKKQKLIGLLQEKRQSIIDAAVTKGLDHNAPMKNSGIAWLGNVPEHWNISRFDYVTTIKARLGWKGLKAEEYVDDGFIFLATPNIKGQYIDFKNVNYITEERYLESPEIMLQEDDVLLTKDGSTLGTVNVVRELPRPSTVNSSIAVIRPGNQISGTYLYYFLSTNYMQQVIQRFKDGMGVPHLFQRDINKFMIILPSITEQKDIVNFLDKKVNKVNILIFKLEYQIEKLQEYRQALISDAVTGKIDVRQYEKEVIK